MPRRRNSQLIIVQEGHVGPPEYNEPTTLVKYYLKDMVYGLLKMKSEENTIECSICLDEICCHKCYALTTCGHGFHLGCIIKCEKCPVCRG